jgi:hypothetical protein
LIEGIVDGDEGERGEARGRAEVFILRVSITGCYNGQSS